MRRVALTAALCGLLLCSPLGASAGHVDPGDGNDTAGPLDVRRVVAWARNSNPVWTIRTWNRWTRRSIWDSGHLLVHFDSFGSAGFDYYALIRSTGTRMRGLLFRAADGRDYVVSGLEVWRPDGRSVAVVVPLRRLRLPVTRTYYRWLVRTLYTGNGCGRVCIDRVPDAGPVTEQVILR